MLEYAVLCQLSNARYRPISAYLNLINNHHRHHYHEFLSLARNAY